LGSCFDLIGVVCHEFVNHHDIEDDSRFLGPKGGRLATDLILQTPREAPIKIAISTQIESAVAG
jgi:hypothetical protein